MQSDDQSKISYHSTMERDEEVKQDKHELEDVEVNDISVQMVR